MNARLFVTIEATPFNVVGSTILLTDSSLNRHFEEVPVKFNSRAFSQAV